MRAELMLESTETSMLIVEERKRRDIVVGVPHHAPAGTSTLPCTEHPEADENAGFLGRYLAEKIDCCSVIACNYTIDANKSAQTDYTMRIIEWSPRILIEIHGHGNKKARSDIEISSGGIDNDRFSMELASRLRKSISTHPELKSISICGEYEKIYYTAKSAVTISDRRWLSYHIELPPDLRKPDDDRNGKPPEIGYQFCRYLAQALNAMNPI